MKVTALARLSTAQGWKLPGEQFTVNAAEAEALRDRGLIEIGSSESADDSKAVPPKPPKSAKAKD